MDTILITGGTGMIGTALARALLNKGYRVIILTRTISSQPHFDSGVEKNSLSYAQWDVNEQTIDNEAIVNADHIIHLAGAGIADKRWTAKRKAEIVDSRVKSSRLLVQALTENQNKVRSVISASAIGWYGPDPEIPNTHPFTEEDPADDGFLGQTCRQWEESLKPVTELNKRLILLRTGIVLSSEDGFLREFEKPLRFGVATILGSGKQVISWIHIDDLVSLYIAAIEREKMNGVYNAVAPAPVSNKNFVIKLARAKRGKFFIPIYVPSFILKIMMGELRVEVLKGATVSSAKIQQTGFKYTYPTVGVALNDL